MFVGMQTRDHNPRLAIPNEPGTGKIMPRLSSGITA